MKKLKLILVMFIVFIVLNSGVWNVSQATNEHQEISITTDRDRVKPGETFVITVSFKSDEGIICLDSGLLYDENSIEFVKTEMQGKWMDYGDDKTITAVSDELSYTGDICNITFKVKENVDSDNVRIDFENTKIYKDYENYSGIDLENVEMKVKKESMLSIKESKSTFKTSNLIMILGGVVGFVIVIILCIVVKKKKEL